jgi:hypothetical protein
MFLARKKQKTSAATYLVDHAQAFAVSDHDDEGMVDEEIAAAAAAAAEPMDVDADECVEDGEDDAVEKEFEHDAKKPDVLREVSDDDDDDDDDGPIEDECAGAGGEMHARVSAFRKKVGGTVRKSYSGAFLESEPTDSEVSVSEDECV